MGADAIDTEENMFLQNSNHEIEEDDDDLLYQPETLLENEFNSFSEEEEEEEQEEQEEEEDPLFDDEENDDDEDDDFDFTEKELADFNKKLGTDFKSIEELKSSFNKQDKESEESKEKTEYTVLTNKLSLYDTYIEMNNETLIKNQLISQAAGEKKDINSQDVLDEIDDKIESLKDLGLLDSQADTLRSNLQNQRDKVQSSIEKIDQKKQAREEEIIRNNVAGLQNALSEVFQKGDFMGITVSKEDINEVYSDIRNNKFFEAVNKDQGTIAKLALFIKYEKEISKLVNAPTHSEKTKSAFEFLANNSKGKARSLASATGTASSGNAEENLLGFIK